MKKLLVLLAIISLAFVSCTKSPDFPAFDGLVAVSLTDYRAKGFEPVIPSHIANISTYAASWITAENKATVIVNQDEYIIFVTNAEYLQYHIKAIDK